MIGSRVEAQGLVPGYRQVAGRPGVGERQEELIRRIGGSIDGVVHGVDGQIHLASDAPQEGKVGIIVPGLGAFLAPGAGCRNERCRDEHRNRSNGPVHGGQGRPVGEAVTGGPSRRRSARPSAL